jgi:hypothetical protein
MRMTRKITALKSGLLLDGSGCSVRGWGEGGSESGQAQGLRKGRQADRLAVGALHPESHAAGESITVFVKQLLRRDSQVNQTASE